MRTSTYIFPVLFVSSIVIGVIFSPNYVFSNIQGLLYLSLPFVLFWGVIAYVKKDYKHAVDSFNYSLLPIIPLYLGVLLALTPRVMLSLNLLATALVFTITYLQLKKYYPATFIRILLCILIYIVLIFEQLVLPPIAKHKHTPLPQPALQISNYKMYDKEHNTIRALPQKWKLKDNEKQVSPKDKIFGISKILWEEHLAAIYNNNLDAKSYYTYHPEIKKFRANDQWWQKWDNMHVNSSFKVETIKSREGINAIEFELRGLHKISPTEKSTLNKSITKPFSINITLYKKSTPNINWCIYYIHNNKL